MRLDMATDAAIDIAIDIAIDADKVQAGPIALLFVVALGVSLVFLLRSLNKQLKRINFERRDEPRQPPPDDDEDRSP
jgi:hypothetical protein